MSGCKEARVVGILFSYSRSSCKQLPTSPAPNAIMPITHPHRPCFPHCCAVKWWLHTGEKKDKFFAKLCDRQLIVSTALFCHSIPCSTLRQLNRGLCAQGPKSTVSSPLLVPCYDDNTPPVSHGNNGGSTPAAATTPSVAYYFISSHYHACSSPCFPSSSLPTHPSTFIKTTPPLCHPSEYHNPRWWSRNSTLSSFLYQQ